MITAIRNKLGALLYKAAVLISKDPVGGGGGPIEPL